MKRIKMSLLRKYISIVETYSKENGYLLRYMKNREFDPYNNWQMVCSWLYNNEFEKLKFYLNKEFL